MFCFVFILGTGLGCIVDPPFAILGQYFDDNYSLANGFAFLGSSTALIVFGPLTQILETTYGWRGTVLVLGGILFNAVVCGALLKPSVRYEQSEYQEYSPLNSASDENIIHECEEDSRIKWWSSMIESLHLSIFKDTVFYIIIIVSSTIRFTQTAWVIYIVPRAIDIGVAPFKATLVATVGGVGDAVGKLLPGIVKYCVVVSTMTIWILGMSIMTVSLILSVVFPTYAGMMVLAFFQGLGLGMSHSLLNVVFKEMFGTEQLVNVMGWVRCFSGVGRFLGGFVPGKLCLGDGKIILILS